MPSQLFKKTVPYTIVDEFLKENCMREGKLYVFSKACFRRTMYHKRVEPFCQSILGYYHLSKKYYADRAMNYTRFTTLLRQLCKLHNIPYTSKIIYNKSTYDIVYYINTDTS